MKRFENKGVCTAVSVFQTKSSLGWEETLTDNSKPNPIWFGKSRQRNEKIWEQGVCTLHCTLQWVRKVGHLDERGIEPTFCEVGQKDIVLFSTDMYIKIGLQILGCRVSTHNIWFPKELA